MSQSTKIFVGNLPHGTKPEKLRHLFEQYGVVVECDVMTHCGFVHMQTPVMADEAVAALNGTNFRGQNIAVERGRPKTSRVVRGGSRSGRSGDSSRYKYNDKYNQSNGSSRAIRNTSFRSSRNAPYNRDSRGGRSNFNDRFRGRGAFDNQRGNNFRDAPSKFKNDGDRHGSNSRRESGFNHRSGGYNNYQGGGGFRDNGNRNFNGGRRFESSGRRGSYNNDKTNGFQSMDKPSTSSGQDRRGFALPGNSGGRSSFRGGFSGGNSSDDFHRRSSLQNIDNGGRGGRNGFSSSRAGGVSRGQSFSEGNHSSSRNYSDHGRNSSGSRGGFNRNGPPRQNTMNRR